MFSGLNQDNHGGQNAAIPPRADDFSATIIIMVEEPSLSDKGNHLG
jgi:hypothetical protein